MRGSKSSAGATRRRSSPAAAAPSAGRAHFRFYEELNDFLARERRKREFVCELSGPRSVKDMIEALGVPHTEVELILVNGESVGFGHRLKDGDRISVYPVFESLDVTPLLRLRPRPLRVTRFVLDTHLGTLSRYLRLLGFDTLYSNDRDDAELARLSHDERRILLTRDVGLLKRSLVTHGCFLRATAPRTQLTEVVERFDLRGSLKPFTRCMHCNGRLAAIARARLHGRVDPGILERHTRFRVCRSCGRAYWAGSHFERLQALVDSVASAPAA